MSDSVRDSTFSEAIADSLWFFRPALAQKFLNCGTDFIVLECKNCNTLHTFSLDCGLRICEVCTKKRWSKLNKKYAPLVRSKNPKKLSLLTLTIKNLKELNKNSIHQLINYFVTFRHRRYVKKRLSGGLWTLEIKGTRGNYNLHIHSLIEHNFYGRPSKYEVQNLKIPERLKDTKGIVTKKDLLTYTGHDIGQIMLSIIWSNISGDPVIDIRRVDDSKEAFRYILKYVTKPPDLDTPQDFADFLIAFYATPMIKLYGSWYNALIILKPFLVCMHCGFSNWKIIMFSWDLKAYPNIEIRGP